MFIEENATQNEGVETFYSLCQIYLKVLKHFKYKKLCILT